MDLCPPHVHGRDGATDGRAHEEPRAIPLVRGGALPWLRGAVVDYWGDLAPGCLMRGHR